ncbi:unnamed protein product [Vicia faba]|uniref:Amino acid transporter transmembrane domain-containing protein n=1 Tax=Vicia faba TaxID=3906 RepID=A0AAV1AL27_VICFA|nr:unnamed protein product [Vicia faba]
MDVEQRPSNDNSLTLNLEHDQQHGTLNDSYDVSTAHTIDQDSWQQVGLMLVTGFNCAYANWLLAAFHFIDGRRFIRYRDLMGFVYGKKMYHLTWISQFLTLLLGNMGFILLGGKALKEINSEFSDSPLRLQYFIVITGVAYLIFSFSIPTLSSMRNWLGVSAVVTTAYIAFLLAVAVKDGKSNPNKDFTISGSKVNKVFNSFGAISAIIVTNTSGMLPEIQSTLRKPAVKNMRKALFSQYTVGALFYYGVTVIGYWAYGSMVSSYLPENLSGPRWINVIVNVIVFLQSVVSQHMFVAPIHEAMDTRFLEIGKGSFSLVPLTFMFPSMIFLKVKGKTARTKKKAWHWINIVFSFLLTIATTISALRFIINNIQKYQFFADA